MKSKQRPLVDHTGSVAAYVRLVAFLVAALAILVIPATLVATAAGQVSGHLALYVVGAAITLVVAATIAVRPFDPLRG